MNRRSEVASPILSINIKTSFLTMININTYFDGLLVEYPKDKKYYEILVSTNGKTRRGNQLTVNKFDIVQKECVCKVDGITYNLDFQRYKGVNTANVETVLPIETAVLTVQDVDNGKYAVKNDDNTYDVLCHTKTMCGDWSVRNPRAQSRHIASNVTPSEITKQNGVYYINDNEYYDVTYNGFMYNGVFVPIEDEYEIVYGDAVDSGVMLKQNGQFYDVYTQEMYVSGNTVVKGDVHYIERNIPYELHGDVVQIDGKDAQYYYIKYTDENGAVNWVNTGEYSFVGEDKRDYTHEEETEDPSNDFDQYTIKKIGDKYYAILYKSEDFATESDFDNYFNSHTLQNLSMCMFIELEPYKSNELEYLEDGTTLVYFYYVKYLDKTLRTDRYDVFDGQVEDVEDPAKADYFSFVTKSPNATLIFMTDENKTPQLEYAIGYSDWRAWNLRVIKTTENQVIYLRGTNQTFDGCWLQSSDKYEIRGCISSIFQNRPNPVVLSETFALHNFLSKLPNTTRIADLILDVSGARCYYRTFADMKYIEETPRFTYDNFELPLSERQFEYSFYNCTNLKIVNDLPNIHISKDCFEGCFKSCTSLEQMPSMPSTDLEHGCYMGMFENSGIRYLTTLPARIVPEFAYFMMFAQCNNLTETIAISCDTAGDSAFREMFRDCENIKYAKPISVHSVDRDAFYYMFSNCTSLTTTAEITDFKIAPVMCFYSMYNNCVSLTKAHDIICDELLAYSCNYMFKNCTSLTRAPKLLAVKVDKIAYNNMFEGCTNLSYIECAMVSNNSVFGNSWVKGVASGGTFVKNVLQTKYSRSIHSIPTSWEIVDKNFYEDPEKADYLAFVTKSTNGTLSFIKDENKNPQIEYAIGYSDWKVWDFSDITTYENQVIYFRGSNQTFNGCGFESQDKYEIRGCISSIFQNRPNPVVLSEENALRRFFRNMPNTTRIADLILDVSGTYCYLGTFANLKNITETPEFANISILCNEQFCQAFENCTNLKIVKDLPNIHIPEYCFNSCFEGCTSLEQMPSMPSTDLEHGCYMGMFINSGIRYLTTLPARIVPWQGYSNMFMSCSNLTDTIPLSCDSIGSNGCNAMYAFCDKIKQPNSISVKEAGVGAFISMFQNCTSLTKTAEIRDLNVASVSCFAYMYKDCKSLTEAHDMKFDQMLETSCAEMFKGCTALINAPRLLTVDVDEKAYNNMFEGCTNLSYIECAMVRDSSVFGNSWVIGVASSGTFVKNVLQAKYEYSNNSIPTGWNIVNKKFYDGTAKTDYLSFVTKSTNATLSFIKDENQNPQLEYSIGDSDWQAWDFRDITTNENQVIYFRGSNQTFNGCRFESQDEYEIKGCISSIFQNRPNPVVLSENDALQNFFTNMPNITRITDLILDVSGERCYYETFANLQNIEETPGFYNIPSLCIKLFNRSFVNCTNLKIVNILPSIHIPEYCFAGCFEGCSSLEQMPYMPSTDLGEGCYYGMFRNSGIRYLTTLPARIVPSKAYSDMFISCSNLTDTIPLSCDSIGSQGCDGMYAYCENIKQPNYISVKEVSLRTFDSMFRNCTSLTKTAEIRDLNIGEEQCFKHMYRDCVSLTEAHDMKFNVLNIQSCYGMFRNCTSLTRAPRLLTVNVNEYGAYNFMFCDCTNLSYIECAMVCNSCWLGSENWVYGVASSGTFVKNKLQTNYQYSNHSIPTGWEIVDKNFSDETEPPVIEPEEPIYTSIILDGGAYFKTDVQPTKGITVEACFKHNSTAERCVFGVSTNNENNWYNDGKLFAVHTTNNQINAYVSTYHDNVATCSQNEWHTVSLKWNSVVFDGVDYGNVWGNTNYSGYERNIYIGARNCGGVSVSNYTDNILTYKYIKIYNNGELIREYVPMLKNGVCLQEKCSGTFVYKDGDGHVSVTVK